MKRLFVSFALLMLLFLTMFPLTVVALSSDEGASTTWGNIKTGTGVNSDSAKLAPSIGSYTKLIVPFYPQLPPGSSKADWDATMNCGQASVLTCTGYLLLKRVCYAYPAPLIVEENKWLAKTYNEPRYLNKYGYVTGGDKINRLEGLARDYWGLKNSKATTNSCSSIDALYSELNAGRPVVVEVITNMAPAPSPSPNKQVYHFMVLIGMKIGADDANSYVWVNDPGKTNGPGNKYTLEKFKKSWANSNNHCVFIRP